MTDETAQQGDPRDEPGRFETKDLPGGYGPAQTPVATTLGHNRTTDSPDESGALDDEAIEGGQHEAPADAPSVSEGGPTNVEKQAQTGNEQPATPEVAEREQAAETGQLHTPDTTSTDPASAST
jgi:hypothetical protein